MSQVPCSVVTAEGVVEEHQVVSVTIPTADGEITVLPEHIPLVSVLVPGVLTLRAKDGQDRHVAVSGGFVHVEPKAVVVLADTAERADDIDATRAEQARKRAAEAMSGKLEKRELAEVSATLEKSLARLRAVELAGRRSRRRKRSVSGGKS